ncbi:MAG: FISUMP domain-containing protein [Bacteroides xylanisolvens]
MTIKYIASFFLCLLASGLSSCSEEESNNLNRNEKQVTIALSIPGLEKGTSPTTYALPDDEDKINTIDVLVFKTDPLFPDDPSKGTYYYNARVAHTIGNTTFTFTARFIDEGENQTIVVLVNCRTEVATLLETISEGDSKADVIQALSLIQATAFSPATMTGIPMWGEITDQDITTAYNPIDLSIKLTRMLAKINIVNNDAENFTLTQAYLYNPRQKGSVIPDNWDELNSFVTTPTIVTGAEMAQGKYFLFSANATNKIENQIYTFEADNATKAVADRLDATCLVVGGRYQSNASTVYYRIDLKDYATDTYFDILRNHSYNVTITSVTDIGTTRDDAYKGISTITANIEVWNEVAGDFQYGSSGLYISNRYPWIDLDGTTVASTEANTFKVRTTAHKGWRIKSKPAWVTLDPTSGRANVDAITVTFTATDATTSHPEGREGAIVIEAANLEYTLYAMQGNCGRNGISLSQTIGKRTYKIHRYPTGTSGAMQCWMVENSKEGFSSGKGYGLDWAGAIMGSITDGSSSYRGQENGYYYTWEQRDNACPEGWSVPTQNQWQSLQTSISNDLGANAAIWWAGTRAASNNAFAGYTVGPTDGSRAWYSWGRNGYWWSSEAYWYYCGQVEGFVGPKSINSEYKPWFSVRCVRD